ncbi:MAG: EamA family transporter [Polyangiaceae bacterium]|nr:EamA family transporter [Polyangiaceae bacterium]
MITWWMFALLSAAFAGATAILAKVGVMGISSNLATAVRTCVVLVFAWGIVIANGEQRGLSKVGGRTLVFLILSGIATGASWLAYFRALQLGPASKVAPIDKTSLAFTLTLAVLFLKEPLTWKLVLGVVLMIAGALVTIT